MVNGDKVKCTTLKDHYLCFEVGRYSRMIHPRRGRNVYCQGYISRTPTLPSKLSIEDGLSVTSTKLCEIIEVVDLDELDEDQEPQVPIDLSSQPDENSEKFDTLSKESGECIYHVQ